MKFLPKSRARYIAALRETFQRRLLSVRIKDDFRSRMRKLTVFSCLSGESGTLPVDSAAFFSAQIAACRFLLLSRGTVLFAELSVNGVRELPCRTLAVLTARLLQKAEPRFLRLTVTSNQNTVRILLHGTVADRTDCALANRNGMVCLNNVTRHLTGLFYPSKPLSRAGLPVPAAKELLTDPFSPVRLFLLP